MNLKSSILILIAFLAFFTLATCDNKRPTKKTKEHDNVAPVLEKSTDFERDTIRKDAMKVVKENKSKQDVNILLQNLD